MFFTNYRVTSEDFCDLLTVCRSKPVYEAVIFSRIGVVLCRIHLGLVQNSSRGREAELCTNLGVIICPLDHHVALMRLQGWIIHFQPNFLLN